MCTPLWEVISVLSTVHTVLCRLRRRAGPRVGACISRSHSQAGRPAGCNVLERARTYELKRSTECGNGQQTATSQRSRGTYWIEPRLDLQVDAKWEIPSSCQGQRYRRQMEAKRHHRLDRVSAGGGERTRLDHHRLGVAWLIWLG